MIGEYAIYFLTAFLIGSLSGIGGLIRGRSRRGF